MVGDVITWPFWNWKVYTEIQGWYFKWRLNKQRCQKWWAYCDQALKAHLGWQRKDQWLLPCAATQNVIPILEHWHKMMNCNEMSISPNTRWPTQESSHIFGACEEVAIHFLYKKWHNGTWWYEGHILPHQKKMRRTLHLQAGLKLSYKL